MIKKWGLLTQIHTASVVSAQTHGIWRVGGQRVHGWGPSTGAGWVQATGGGRSGIGFRIG